jgi:hypothetical protein
MLDQSDASHPVSGSVQSTTTEVLCSFGDRGGEVTGDGGRDLDELLEKDNVNLLRGLSGALSGLSLAREGRAATFSDWGRFLGENDALCNCGGDGAGRDGDCGDDGDDRGEGGPLGVADGDCRGDIEGILEESADSIRETGFIKAAHQKGVGKKSYLLISFVQGCQKDLLL